MAIPVVTLQEKGSMDPAFPLPIHFSYRLPRIEKRISVSPTCGSVVIQEALNCSVVPGSIIPFEMKGSCATEYKMFYDLYTSCDETNGGSKVYVWNGYWGESYDVIFYALDEPVIKGRLFDFSGSFLILCLNTHPNPTNGF